MNYTLWTLNYIFMILLRIFGHVIRHVFCEIYCYPWSLVIRVFAETKPTYLPLDSCELYYMVLRTGWDSWVFVGVNKSPFPYPKMAEDLGKNTSGLCNPNDSTDNRNLGEWDRDRLSLLRVTLQEKLDTIKTLDAYIVELIEEEIEQADACKETKLFWR